MNYQGVLFDDQVMQARRVKLRVNLKVLMRRTPRIAKGREKRMLEGTPDTVPGTQTTCCTPAY